MATQWGGFVRRRAMLVQHDPTTTEVCVDDRQNGSPVTGAVTALAGAFMIAGATLPWYRITVDLSSLGAPGSPGPTVLDAGAMQSTALVVALVGIALLAAGAWLLGAGNVARCAVPLAAVGLAVVAVTLVSAFELRDEQLGDVLQLQSLFGNVDPFVESLAIGVWLSVAGGVLCVASGVLASLGSKGRRSEADSTTPVAETYPVTD
jgi:hypothetical protein